MKDAKRHHRPLLWALSLLLLGAMIWFGLPPYYQPLAIGVAVLCLPCLLWSKWGPWLLCLCLMGLGVLLCTFRAAGYHYAALLPLGAAVLLVVFRLGKRRLKVFVSIGTGLLSAFLLSALLPILAAAYAGQQADAPYVIVLGAAVYGQTPSISLRHRLDKAAAYLNDNPEATAVVSGGQGEGEDISEAECMRRYLVDKGIDESRILMEAASTSTLENLTFSKAVIEASGGDAAEVAIVSSAYHLYRAKGMAKSLGMEARGIASQDGYPVYMAGMYIREALAVWKLWLFGV